MMMMMMMKMMMMMMDVIHRDVNLCDVHLSHMTIYPSIDRTFFYYLGNDDEEYREGLYVCR